MTVPISKQKKIASLFQEGMSPSEIAKKTRVDYKTAKKYSGLSTTLQPQLPSQQRSVVDGCSPKFAPPKSKKPIDTTRSYAYYENVPYYRPVRVALPSGRDLVNTPDAKKPLVPLKPLTKMQKEQEEPENRKGIDVSWVQKENARREALRQRIQRDAMEEIRKREHNKKISQHINDIQSIIIEKNRKKNREIFEIPTKQGFSGEGIQQALREVADIDREEQKKKIMAYKSLKALQHGEIYRIKKKQINDKFVGYILPSFFDLLDNIVKSASILNSKPKIVKAQLPKKPMKAIVIK